MKETNNVIFVRRMLAILAVLLPTVGVMFSFSPPTEPKEVTGMVILFVVASSFCAVALWFMIKNWAVFRLTQWLAAMASAIMASEMLFNWPRNEPLILVISIFGCFGVLVIESILLSKYTQTNSSE